MSSNLDIGAIMTIEQVADIVLNCFDKSSVKKHESKILGRTLTLKDRFVVHFQSEGVRPRKTLSFEYIEKMVLIKTHDKEFNINDPKPKFEVFNCFFEYYI